MEITGTMIWGFLVSVILLLIGNTVRVKSAESAEEKRAAKILADRMLVVETKMVEEYRVREIVSEALKDLKEGQSEIRTDIKGLTSDIHELTQLVASRNMGS